MVPNLKKSRHHYVWQYYLRSWQDASENVNTLFMSNSKVVSTKTNKIAVIRDFYKMYYLNKSDVDTLRKLAVMDSTAEILKLTSKQFIDDIEQIYLKDELVQQIKSTEVKQKCVESLDIIYSNYLEDCHTKIEKLARTQLRELIDNKTANFWSNSDKKFTFLMYIAIQYLRTNSLKQRAYNTVDARMDKLIDIKKIWNILSILLGVNVGYSLDRNPNYKLVFLQNDNGTPFITGDQPVFNTFATAHNEGDQIDNLELYYPLSPTNAILITEDKKYKLFDIIKIDDTVVNQYNDQIIYHAHEQIYSNDLSYLSMIAEYLS